MAPLAINVCGSGSAATSHRYHQQESKFPQNNRQCLESGRSRSATGCPAAVPHFFPVLCGRRKSVTADVSAIAADMFLGVPFNIASYALLLHMVALITHLRPAEFIHSIGDAHIYMDTIEQCKQQVVRKPLPLPNLRIRDRGQSTIDDFEMDDFQPGRLPVSCGDTGQHGCVTDLTHFSCGGLEA